ncbi:hypothetical protein RDI58_000682 [Solanum bulbocastanum]|uniref:Pentatricopeptide repeat-containing protein n=1 Tax=Solanum bulbocastanum TaxID=147425 RepID=A0AAN8U6M2_SOLBU
MYFLLPETSAELENATSKMKQRTITTDRGILCMKRRAPEAQSFFDSLKDKFEVDVALYTSLVHGWCRAGNISEAERIFREMKDAGSSLMCILILL